MSAELSCKLPENLHSTLASWLKGAKHPEKLAPEAQLLPLLADLPPPAARSVYRVTPLDAVILRSFELRPVAAATTAAASAAGAAVDPRQRIWELTHIVHEVYTNHWPHKWERPTFARDPQNPTPDEWQSWPEQMLKSENCKQTLERWRDECTRTAVAGGG